MAKDISQYSAEELSAELKRRNETSAPKPLENIDWEPVKEAVIEGIEEIFKEGHQDDDFEHWIYEAALEAVYGKDVWDVLNPILAQSGE